MKRAFHPWPKARHRARPAMIRSQEALSFWADEGEGIIFDPKRKAIYKEVNYGFTIK